MSDLNLMGKTALITGAASGIGRSVSTSLAKQGCNLILVDINTDELEKTVSMAEKSGVNVFSYTLNIADKTAINELANKITKQNQLDILVNNAGVALWSSFEETSPTDFDWIFNINFHGMVEMTRAFLPHLKKRDAAQIVNISSIFGIVSPTLQVAYSASKFAIRGFSEGLREELHTTNVGVTVVHPGGIATNIAHHARAPKTYSAQKVAYDIEQTKKHLNYHPTKLAKPL